MNDFADLIIGSWTKSENIDNEHGIGIDTFFKGGKKDTAVTVFTIGQGDPVNYLIKSTWSISGRVVTEKVTEIDKGYTKLAAIKKGTVIRYRIMDVSAERLVLLPLDNKHLKPVEITYRRSN